MPNDLDEIISQYADLSGVHPACLAIPEIEAEDQEALNTSIAASGLRHEILLTHDGQLLDGRNRLIACHQGQVEPRFRRLAADDDPWQTAFDENVARRHLSAKARALFGERWRRHERELAKERQRAAGGDRRNKQAKKSLKESLPGAVRGQSRDKIGKRVGVSGRSVDKAADILEYAPELAADESQSLESAHKTARKRKKILRSRTDASPTKQKTRTTAKTTIVTAGGKESQIPLPKKTAFRKSVDAPELANWAWDPVTGCRYTCSFCYAREAAHAPGAKEAYPNRFRPTFYEHRLAAPKNTKRPESDDPRDGRVLVCSMADLFGGWVPDEWIEAVAEACVESPEWEYVFLTRNPVRYAKLPVIPGAWYGASVAKQSDVERVERAMGKVNSADVVRWISLEPMLEPIKFTDLAWCDLVVLGGQTETRQPDGQVPEFAPAFDWVVDVVNQCREAGVPYTIKSSLGKEPPGMALPASEPRRRPIKKVKRKTA